MAKSKYTAAFALVTSLFFMWGFITVLVDSLVPRLKEVFELSYAQANMVQVAFFSAYGLISIPAGSFMSKIGYKKGVMLGLLTMGLGCLLYYPASATRLFPVFLVASFILSSGMAILQVAANPYVAALGEERTASSRLNLSQAFNSLGTMLAPVIGGMVILSETVKTQDEIALLTENARTAYFTNEAAAVQVPFILLAVSLVVLAGIVAIAKLPKVLEAKAPGRVWSVFRNKKLALGAIGIFLYVGAEVAIGTSAVSYFNELGLADLVRSSPTLSSVVSFFTQLFNSPPIAELDDRGIMQTFVIFYWGGAMIGRFIGSGLTKKVKPNNVLSIFASSTILLIAISIFSEGFIAMWSLLLIGLFNSIMFPTIFTIALHGMGEQKPHGSGILCTAIVGAAVIPVSVGAIADASSFNVAFAVISLCYAYVLYYGIWSNKYINA